MPVDTGEVLHVLAHELRTPTGIAQGYARLLLDDRLTDPAEQRRALEQIQKALGRIAELSHQSSALAGLLELDRAPATIELSVADVVDRISNSGGDHEIIVRAESATSDRVVRTFDDRALLDAVVTMVRATAREIRSQPCTVRVVTSEPAADLFIGPESDSAALAAGPRAAEAVPASLERGGLGLTLVQAVVVLESQGAECWTVGEARNILGVRLPLHERAHL